MLGTNEVVALHGMSLSIESGGITALMGPSGSGKSTLLNLLGALDTPTSGSVIVADHALNDLNADQRATYRNQVVGFIFQNFNLIPVLTTIENVVLPAHLASRGMPAKELTERARRLLEAVGLEGQINQGVNRLSGGQMQRVAIARALINKPRLILADEPTANLDHETSDKILNILGEVCAREGATVVMTTHDDSVLRFCNRIVSLRDGKLIDDQKLRGR